MSPDGSTQVGKISKQWSGLLREAFTDTDYFGVSFPMDLDVRMKAVLIGAVFLIVSFTLIHLLLYYHIMLMKFLFSQFYVVDERINTIEKFIFNWFYKSEF